MAINIRKELSQIIVTNEKIINALKLQKVRQETLTAKYQEKIDEEMELPQNRFLNWTRSVQPYLDSAISAKIIDVQLIKQYNRFIKEVIRYESDYILSEQDIVDLEYNYDSIVEIALKLESKIIQLRKSYTDNLERAKISAIGIYQKTPIEDREFGVVCNYCGIVLDPDQGDGDEECNICADLPENVRPILTKYGKGSKQNKKSATKVKKAVKKVAEPVEEETETAPEMDPAVKEFIESPDDEEMTVTSSEDYTDTDETVPFIEPDEEEKDNTPILTPEEIKKKKDFNKLMKGLENKYEFEDKASTGDTHE